MGMILGLLQRILTAIANIGVAPQQRATFLRNQATSSTLSTHRTITGAGYLHNIRQEVMESDITAIGFLRIVVDGVALSDFNNVEFSGQQTSANDAVYGGNSVGKENWIRFETSLLIEHRGTNVGTNREIYTSSLVSLDE